MLKHGRNFPITLALFFIEGILFVVFLVWYNQEIYEVYEPNPLLQGLRFTVFYGAITLLAPFIANYCSKKKSVKAALTAGNGFAVLAAALMATVGIHSGKVVIVYAALAGVGLAAPLVVLMTTVHLCAPADLIHAVAPLATLMRTVGIVVGNVLASLVVNTRFSMALPQQLTMAFQPLNVTIESNQLPALIQVLRMRSDHALDIIGLKDGFSPEVLQAAREASTMAQLEAFRFVWVAVAALAGLGMLGNLVMSPVTSVTQNSIMPDPQEAHSYSTFTPQRSTEHGFLPDEKRGLSDTGHSAV
ncbi:hypothetical protein K439DRAFT_252847 [Ramaria rubella]|nr:hypothetical protein K439DRAFT_336357 [Ramaria rubella]KAF8581107.1 hypothetical protein K439DRAFT_252847 [Ramaria rubella]